MSKRGIFIIIVYHIRFEILFTIGWIYAHTQNECLLTLYSKTIGATVEIKSYRVHIDPLAFDFTNTYLSDVIYN